MATRVEELRQTASTAWDAFSHEMAQYSDENLPTAEQAAHIDELRTTATAAQRELTEAERFMEQRAAWESEQAGSNRIHRPPAALIEDIRRPQASLGARFVALPEFQAWLRTVAPNGQIANRSIVSSPPLAFRGLSELNALVTAGDVTSGGALIVPDQYAQITEFGRRPLTVRSVITNLQTDSDSVEFVRITAETNNAAVVPEATATDSAESGAEPGFKPESDLAFERVNTPVKTIAHWIAATSRALQDASSIRGIIDAFLRYGVELELEDQIVQGDGIGENFDGILATQGLQVQPFVDDVFKTTRQARRKVRTIGRRIPNAYLFNPVDWENIELQKDANERYYFNGPINQGPLTLWGLPVIESEAVPEGTGLVGDFTTCVLWDRMQASISVSNSHADFFIRNLVAILCELRAAFGVLKPNALVEIEMAGS